MLILAFVVIPFALACYSIFSPDPFRESPVDFRPAGFYSLGEERPWPYTHGSSGLEFRYHIGMSREEIRKSFAFGARLIASYSRPRKDWSAIGNAQPALDYFDVLEFELGLPSGLVAVCDVYDDGRSHHALYFDDKGILVGAQQSPGVICQSACVESANEAASADRA